MTTHERRLAGITVLALLLISGLAFLPVTVLLTVVGPILLICTVASVWMLSRALSRPLTPLDEELSCIDRELDREAEVARQVRRLERQRAREVGYTAGGGWRVR